jgi:hypothetical protein
MKNPDILNDRINTPPPAPSSQRARDTKTAQNIVRGTERLLMDMGLTPIREFSLSNGRRVDVAALGKKGRLAFIEVKSSLADFRSDKKWPGYLEFCDTFYFAVAPDFPQDVLPAEHGLIIADRYGAEIIRPDSAEKTLNGARRKAVTLKFARAAAGRLTTFLDQKEDL